MACNKAADHTAEHDGGVAGEDPGSVAVGLAAQLLEELGRVDAWHIGSALGTRDVVDLRELPAKGPRIGEALPSDRGAPVHGHDNLLLDAGTRIQAVGSRAGTVVSGKVAS